MRTGDEIKNVLELFNLANQAQEAPGSNTEAIYDTLRWVYYEGTPDHVMTTWLPSGVDTTSGDAPPIPGTDTESSNTPPPPGADATPDPAPETAPERSADTATNGADKT